MAGVLKTFGVDCTMWIVNLHHWANFYFYWKGWNKDWCTTPNKNPVICLAESSLHTENIFWSMHGSGLWHPFGCCMLATYITILTKKENTWCAHSSTVTQKIALRIQCICNGKQKMSQNKMRIVFNQSTKVDLYWAVNDWEWRKNNRPPNFS